MIDIDIENERMVKEYIEGNTIFDMVKKDISVEQYLSQVRKMAALAKSANLNQKNVTLININLNYSRHRLVIASTQGKH